MCRINKQFRVYKTTNAEHSIYDIKHISALARKLDRAYRAAQRTNSLKGIKVPEFPDESFVTEVIRSHVKENGVCAGMVCAWAQDYIFRVKPGDPNHGDASLADTLMECAPHLQAIYKGSAVSRYERGPKLDRDTLNYKSLNKMYKTRGMTHDDYFEFEDVPVDTGLYKKEFTNKLLDRLDATPGVPHVLCVSMGTTDRLGYHHIGLVKHANDYLALEPNGGLYRFPSAGLFVDNFDNYLKGNVTPDSMWDVFTLRDINQKPTAPTYDSDDSGAYTDSGYHSDSGYQTD